MNTIRKFKIVIVVLSCLLAVSLGLLTVQVVRRVTNSTGAATVKNNSITAAEQTWTFGGEGLLPGDSLSRDYTVRLNQTEEADLLFTVQVGEDARQLARALRITVVNTTTGKTVCQGVLAEVTEQSFRERMPYTGQEGQIITYHITVTVDTAAGNEYQNATLQMGFQWSIASAGQEEGDRP